MPIDTLTPVNKWNYVVVISDHNVSEAIACLHFMPERIITIATKKYSMACKQFAALICQKMPNAEIHNVDTSKLVGDSFHESLHWAKTVLLPSFSNTNENVLNATGGTKALIMALEKSINWRFVHYKSQMSDFIECWEYENNKNTIKTQRSNNENYIQLNSPLTETFSVNDACLLYVDSLEKDKTEYFTPSQPLALTLAEEISDCLTSTRKHTLHPHQLTAELMFNVWYKNKDDHNKEENIWFTQSIDVLSTKKTTAEQLQKWGCKLQNTCPDIFRVTSSEFSIRTFFKRNTRKQKMFLQQKEWISGGWLESLLFNKLQKIGISENYMHQGLRIKADKENDNNQGSEREIDLAIFHNQRIHIIEIKAGLNSRADFKEAVRQLASLTALTGAKKILFLGPWANKIYQQNKNENYSLAKGSQVQVITNIAVLLNEFR